MRRRDSLLSVEALLVAGTLAVSALSALSALSSCRRETVAPVAVLAPAPSPPAVGPAGAPARRVSVQVTESGFVPDKIDAEAGKPITLVVTRTTDRTCARELTIKGQPGKTELPLNRQVEITYTPPAPGTVPFGCAMGMMVSGAFEVK